MERPEVCEDLKREFKLEVKGFRERWDREFRKELRDVKDTINFITKAYDEIKDHLDTILNEKKERNSLNT